MAAEALKARVRVSLQTGELEVEGSEAFVARYSDALEALIGRVQETGPVAGTSTEGGRRTSPPEAEGGLSDFPEALHRMTSNSGTDQILLAGSHVRLGRPDGVFSTTEANALLLEQGIKLANPSQSMANNLKAKRVFKSGKNWKISRTGEEYLRTLV